MNCSKHIDRPATGQCINCLTYLCTDCVEKKKAGTKYLDICPKCRDLVRPIKTKAYEKPFYKMIGHVFNYPFAPRDRYKLIGYGIFLFFMALMYTIMPLNPIFYANWIIKIALWAIFVSYLIKATNTVGMGSMEVPDWPDFVMWWESLVVPSIRVSLTWIVLVALPLLIGIGLVLAQIGWGLSDLFSAPHRINTEKQFIKSSKEMQKSLEQMYEQKMSPEEFARMQEEFKKSFEDELAKIQEDEDKPGGFSDQLRKGGSIGNLTAGLADYLYRSPPGKERFTFIVLILFAFGALALVGSLLYPMAFYIAAGFGSLKNALNPVLIAKLILKVPADYFVLIAFIIASSIIEGITISFFGLTGLSKIVVLGKFFDLCIKFYFGLVFAFMVGRFAYVNRYELGFDVEEELPELTPRPKSEVQSPTYSPKTSGAASDAPIPLEFESTKDKVAADNPHLQKPQRSAPSFEVKTPLDEDILKGREFKRLGEFDSALECFNLALSVDPTHPVALRECFKIYLLKGDSEKAANAVNKLMVYYTSKDKRDEALILFSEVLGVLPMHTFGQLSQKKLANWLKEVGDYTNAVIAYRNYAYRFVKDPFAATSLMEAGTILKFELRNPKLAAKVFKLLLKNYPNSPESQRAKTLLGDGGTS